MTKRMRVVQVGLGDWGRDWAWRVVPSVREVEPVGFVDSDPQALALLAKKLPSSRDRTFTSLNDAIDVARPDALLITTTLAGHAPLTRIALEAGMHVLVEKPFADSIEGAEELVSLAAARRLTLMVSQNYRHFPAAREAARLIQDGDLGDLHSITIDFRRDNSSPPHIHWRQHVDPQPLLVDMSIHHFDLLRLMLGRDPDRLLCVTSDVGRGGFEGPPTAAASILFGEVVVSYRGSWISAGPKTPWAGEWSMEFERGQVAWTSRGDNGVLHDRVTTRLRRGRPRVITLPEMTRIDRAGTLSEFANAVREGREPETSGRDNLGTLAFTMAAVESSARGEWVELQPARTRSAAQIR